MRQRAANDIGVTDQRNRQAAMATAKALHQPKHPDLNLDHQLAAGNARAATQRIKIAPLGDAAQVVESPPGPFAIINLVKLRGDLDTVAKKLPQEIRGLARSWLRAAVDLAMPSCFKEC